VTPPLAPPPLEQMPLVNDLYQLQWRMHVQYQCKRLAPNRQTNKQINKNINNNKTKSLHITVVVHVEDHKTTHGWPDRLYSQCLNKLPWRALYVVLAQTSLYSEMVFTQVGLIVKS